MIDLNFWVKVDFDGPVVKSDLGPCWLWMGHLDKTWGYGRYTWWDKLDKRTRIASAHRYAYKQFFGEIPTNLTIDHLCRTRSCMNPWHYDTVTGKVNTLRGESLQAQNARKVNCPKGHPLVPDPWRPKRRYCHTCELLRAKINYQKRKGLLK